jgi:hypothetical protein
MRRRAVKINRALQYAYERRTMLAEPPVLAASAQARVGPGEKNASRRRPPQLAHILTVGTAGSYIFRYGNGSETIGAFVHHRCPAAAQLMSVTASPGRAWSLFIAECRLLVLATALATGFPHGGARITHLSGLARAAPAALFPHLGSQGDFWRQPDSESRSAGILERAMVSLLVNDLSSFFG